MNAEDYEWFGLISPEDVKDSVTFITPLAFFSQDGMWESIPASTRRQLYPDNGKAVIFDQHFPLARTNQLLQFRPERNWQITDAYPNTYGYSYYLVSSNLQAPQLAQIFDWTAKVTSTFDIPELLDQGIPIQDCYCQRIYISCSSRLFGPIKLERDADKDIFRPREYIHSTPSGGLPLYVWMYTKPDEGAFNLADTYKDIMLLDESFLDTPTGKEDWSLPQVTIKQVLLASNEALDGIEDSVCLIDERIRELVRLSSQEGPLAVHLDPTTLKKARTILNDHMDRLHNLQEVVGQFSPEHPLIKIAREIEIQTRSQELEREAVALVHEQQQQLQQIQHEAKLAQEKLYQLQAATEAAQKLQQQATIAMDAFEQTIHERLAMIKEEPVRFLAEHQITASLLPLLMDGSLHPAYETRIPLPTTPDAQHPCDAYTQERQSMSGLDWNMHDETERIQTPLHALQLQKWRKIAHQSGVNSKDVRVCIAALLTGLIPVIDGDAAIPTLRAVAQTIAGGRATIVPIPVTALTMLDLFGSIDQYQRAFIPSNGLADCVVEAREHPDELVVVILDGIDRIPGMPAYVPLLRQYFESRQPGTALLNSASLPLFHPRAVASGDPYLSLAQFIWPSNLLLTATVDNDSYGHSMPSMCDPWTVPWETTFKESATYARRTFSGYSSASWEQWKAWQDEVQTNSMNNKDFHGALNQRQRLFYAALTLLDIKEPDTFIELIWPEQFQEDEVEEGVV